MVTNIFDRFKFYKYDDGVDVAVCIARDWTEARLIFGRNYMNPDGDIAKFITQIEIKDGIGVIR